MALGKESEMGIWAKRLRAMYAGGRAGPGARMYSRLWGVVFGLGLAPKRWVTLEVTGRRSGRVTNFPIGMADWHDEWYLVPMLGAECNWVRNVRAAGGQATLRRRGSLTCCLVEVPENERAPIIKRYLEKVPGGRPHIPVDCHAVRNVRAAGGQATLRRRGSLTCCLVEVPENERAPIIKRYLEKVPGGRPHIPVDCHAPLAEFSAIAARYPVFRVVPGTASRGDADSPRDPTPRGA